MTLPAKNAVEPVDSDVLTVRGLGKDFVEKRPFSRTKAHVTAFADIHLTVRRATTLAIVGESGAGKSTLARCLGLLERPSQGEIWFEGQNLATLTKRELRPIRGKIQMIFQDPGSALNPGMTAEEIIAEPLVIQRVGTKADRRARAIELLREVGLDEGTANKRPFEVSGGQKQRLAIARALVLTPEVLILDEACSGLDLKTQQVILELLAGLRATRGMSFIYISHDLRTVAEFADEIAVMHRGRIVEQNASHELLDEPRAPYSRDLLAAMPSMETICAQRLVGALR